MYSSKEYINKLDSFNLQQKRDTQRQQLPQMQTFLISPEREKKHFIKLQRFQKKNGCALFFENPNQLHF